MFDLDAYLARIGLSGRPGPAEGAALARKLVAERRGGYCFEQNMLLAGALRALGAGVDLFLARIRVGVAPGTTRPRSHLLLRVRSAGESWHADVGFGMGTSARCASIRPGGCPRAVRVALSDRPGGARAGAADARRRRVGGPLGFSAPAQGDDGARVSLSDWGELALTERTPAGSIVTRLTREQIPGVLGARFGLEGFALGPDGRSVSAR